VALRFSSCPAAVGLGGWGGTEPAVEVVDHGGHDLGIRCNQRATRPSGPGTGAVPGRSRRHSGFAQEASSLDIVTGTRRRRLRRGGRGSRRGPEGGVLSGNEPPVPAPTDQDVERHLGKAGIGFNRVVVGVEGDPADMGNDDVRGRGEGLNGLVA
jgi:hypothetical protein